MPHPSPHIGHSLRRGLAEGTVIVLLTAALMGCEGVPRDTTATPPPPRQPIATGDDVYPAPTSVRDTRPPARTP
ncbi:hypothetical protein LMG23992_04478 [Cupriavidus laharis]|uniref:Uncharacterized protein n=1 Tax=Cupriavidus laharis TaxID=151654 RepID=A0ABN7Z5T9_9BURK|nr:hypothetical protein LMG23992_04478 [Cupriavidus laharis]